METSKSTHISSGGATLLAIVAFIMGGILAWIAFNSPDGIPLPQEAGNAADWVAAIAGMAAAGATWVIGIVANRYQKEAEFRRIADAKEKKDDARAARVRKLGMIEVKLRRAARLSHVLKVGSDAQALEKLGHPSATGILKAAMKLAGMLTWTAEEVMLLDIDDQINLADVEMNIAIVVELAGQYGMVEEEGVQLTRMRVTLKNLYPVGMELAKISEALIQRLQTMK